jgi:hypothetical protein
LKLVECINDTGYTKESLTQIENFPIKGEIYTLRRKVIANGKVGYLLEEIVNPLMPNTYEPNFSEFRFKHVNSNLDIEQLLEETKIVYEDI